MKHTRALHIFRRDLRLADNTALLHALHNSTEVIPCFILDPRQVSDKNNYRSLHAMQFMFASLRELDEALRRHGSQLYLFYGEAEKVVLDLLQKTTLDISLVTWNRDYTPFARTRDESLEKLCKKNDVEASDHSDALLQEPGDVIKNDGSPYTVFTPFYKRSLTVPVRAAEKSTPTNYYTKKIQDTKDLSFFDDLLPEKNDQLRVKGGRNEGLRLIRNLSKLTDYKDLRNYPAEEHTSYLSAHHKFGTVSVRETIEHAEEVFGKGHHFISEVYWRDFFTHIAHHFPRVFG
ncbi:MAG: deoxyribodipyrimidine photo-lyase, partial [Candidatus Dependentiae bacterium]